MEDENTLDNWFKEEAEAFLDSLDTAGRAHSLAQRGTKTLTDLLSKVYEAGHSEGYRAGGENEYYAMQGLY